MFSGIYVSLLAFTILCLPQFHPCACENMANFLAEEQLYMHVLFLSQRIPKDYKNKSVCEGHGVFCEGKHSFSWLFLDLYWLNF